LQSETAAYPPAGGLRERSAIRLRRANAHAANTKGYLKY